MSITSSNAFSVLVEIGKEFTSRHNTEEEVLRFICEKAGRLMDAKNLVAILQKSDQLNVVLAFQDGHEVPLNQSVQEQLLRQVGRKKVECIIEQKTWILLRDKKQVQEMAESPEENYASWVGVPMCLQDRAIGVVVLYHPEQEGLYDEDDANILDAITDLAANEIENIRLVRAEKTKTNALTELHKIGQDLLNIEHSQQDSGTFLRNIAERAQEILQADLIEVFEYFPDIQQYKTPQIVVGEKLYPEMSAQKISEADEVVFKEIYEKGPLYIQNSQTHDAFIAVSYLEQQQKRFVVREKILSTAAVPLQIHSEKMGLLFVNYRSTQQFTNEQKKIIELFANEASLAIKNIHLFQLEQKARQQAESLKETARIINESLELPDMAKHIFGQLKKVLEYNSVSLQLIEGDCRQIIGHDGFPFHENYPKKLLKNISEDSLISKIVQSKQPFVLSETEKFPELWTVYDETRHIKSWIGVPLLVKEQVIGLLTIDHKQVGYYTDKSKEIAVAFANIVAPALMNLTLFKQAKTQLEQRINDFNDLRDIYQFVNTQELYTLLEEILKKSVKITSTDYADVWLYNPQTKTIRIEVDFEQRRIKQLYQKEQRQFGIQDHKSIVGRVVNSKRSYRCDDVQHDEYYWENEPDVRSELAIPLISQNEVIGVLNFESKKVAAFTEEHQKLLEALAAPTAIAIRNTTLYNELNRLSSNRKILVEIEQELSAGINQKQEDILRLIYTQASKLPGMKENFSIVMFDEASKIIEFKLAYQNGANVKLDSPGWEARELQPKDAQGIGKTDHIIHQKSPLYLSTKTTVKEWGFHETPGFKGYVQGQQAASWLGVPMIVGKKVLGVLATYHYTQEYFYTIEDVELFQALGKHAAIALENARLYEHEENAKQRLNALLQIGQKITTGIHLKEEELLELLYQQFQEKLKMGNFSIALYDLKTKTIRFVLASRHEKRIDIANKAGWESRNIDGKGKTETIFRTKQSLFLNSYQEVLARERKRHQGWQEEIPNAWIGVPMMVEDKVIGVLANYHYGKDYFYQQEDIDIFQALANLAAIALEHARLYRKLAEERNRLRTLIDNIPDRIYAKDTQGHFTLANTATLKKYGFNSMKELLGKTDFDLIPSERAQQYYETEQEMFRTGQQQTSIETAWENLDGKTIALLTTKVLFSDEQGKLLGLVGIGRDISELKQAEKDLKKANQELEIRVAERTSKLEVLSQRQEVLIDLAQNLTSNIGQTEDEILQLLYKNASELMDTSNMYIALYNKATDEVRFPLAYKDGKPLSVVTRKAGQGRTEDIIRRKKPIFIRTREESIRWYQQLGRAEYIGDPLASWIGVPMIIGDKVLGVVATYHSIKDYVYNEDDLKMLQSMGNIAAIALENARLYNNLDALVTERTKKLDKITDKQDILIELAQKLTSDIRLSEEQVVRLIYDNASKLMNTLNMYIALYDETSDNVRFPLAYKDSQPLSIETRKAGKGKTEEIIRTKKPILHKTQQEANDWYAQPERKEYTGHISPSWIGVPIKFGETALGVVATYHPTQDYVYDEDDLKILQTMGNLAAIALENARLYREIEQKFQEVHSLAQELRKVNEEKLLRERFDWIKQMSAEFAHKMVNVAGTIPPRIAEAREQVNIESLSGRRVMKQLEAINRNVQLLIKAAQEIRQTTKTSLRKPEDFVIRDLVDEAIRDVWQENTELANNVLVERHYAETPLAVSTDKVGIQRIFTEIVQNALEAMKGKGTLTITERLGQIENRPCIDVIFSNTGIKIPENTLSKIFDLFYTTKEAGLGLALSQGKSLMKFLGGDIEVESMEGETSFTVKIPVQQGAIQ